MNWFKKYKQKKQFKQDIITLIRAQCLLNHPNAAQYGFGDFFEGKYEFINCGGSLVHFLKNNNYKYMFEHDHTIYDIHLFEENEQMDIKHKIVIWH